MIDQFLSQVEHIGTEVTLERPHVIRHLVLLELVHVFDVMCLQLERVLELEATQVTLVFVDVQVLHDVRLEEGFRAESQLAVVTFKRAGFTMK